MECNETGVAESSRTSMWVDKRTTEAQGGCDKVPVANQQESLAELHLFSIH